MMNIKGTLLFLPSAIFMLLLMACGASAETKALATAKAQLEATNKVLEDNNVVLEAEAAELKAASEALEDNNLVLEAEQN